MQKILKNMLQIHRANLFHAKPKTIAHFAVRSVVTKPIIIMKNVAAFHRDALLVKWKFLLP